MTDQRNLFLTLTLALAVLLGWNYIYEAPKQRAAQEARALQAAQQAEQTSEIIEQTADVIAAPTFLPRAEVLDQGGRVKILTDRLHGSIALKGAVIDDLTLANFRQTVAEDSPEVELLLPRGTEAPYYAEFGWSTQGLDVPTPSTIWQADSDTLTVEAPVTLSWTNDKGIRFEQIIALDENYLFTVEQRVVNNSDSQVFVTPYGLISRAGKQQDGQFVVHKGAIGIIDNQLVETSYTDLEEERQIKETTTGGWFGLTDHYWLVALLPDQSQQIETRFNYVERAQRTPRYQLDYTAPDQVIAPGATAIQLNHLFAGAKEIAVIDQYEEQLELPRFDRAIDFGWYYFLTKPMLKLLDFLATQTGSFAIALLVMTIIVKAALFPLAHKSYVSMSKMKILSPKIREIQDKFGDDKQRLQQELMKLYSSEKVNPLSGCLPILVQIPIFFSLYKVFSIAIEMRHAPFFGWIDDMTAPDPTVIWNLFGLFDYDPSLYLPGFLLIGAWPILMAATMLLQQLMNPAPSDPSQAIMMRLMPVFFLFLLGGFAAGLVIYWTWSNLLSIIQQYAIMKKMGATILEPSDDDDKKSGSEKSGEKA